MTAQQQLASTGISADAFEGLIIIEMDRPYMSFTPAEVERFAAHLNRAYKDALTRDRAKQREATR